MSKDELEQFLENTNTKIAILRSNQERFAGQISKIQGDIRAILAFIKLDIKVVRPDDKN